MKRYISLFNDIIRIAPLEDLKDKTFGFSLNNGLYDYDQFNFKWFCVCWFVNTNEKEG